MHRCSCLADTRGQVKNGTPFEFGEQRCEFTNCRSLVVEQTKARSNCVECDAACADRWRLEQAEEVHQALDLNSRPLGCVLSANAPADSGLQLCSLVGGNQLEDSLSPDGILEELWEVYQGRSDTTEIVSVNRPAKKCIEHPQNAGIEESAYIEIGNRQKELAWREAETPMQGGLCWG